MTCGVLKLARRPYFVRPTIWLTVFAPSAETEIVVTLRAGSLLSGDVDRQGITVHRVP